MKKLTILAMCIVAMACSKTGDDLGIIRDISIDDISSGNIYSINNDFDREAVAESLTTKLLLIEETYVYMYSQNEWSDWRLWSSGGYGATYHGFRLDGNSWISYCETENITTGLCGELHERVEDVRFDKETTTIYFDSSCYDHEYGATVVYFDGEIVVFEGVLPHSDAWSDNYPEKHLCRYVGVFSDEPVDEWVEKLRQKIAEEHKDCHKGE